MNVIIFVSFILTVSCTPFLRTGIENDAKKENEVDARRGSHFQGEVYVPMVYGSSSESNPLLLKRTKRKGIKFGGFKGKKPKPPKPKPVPGRDYPRQPGYPQQPNPGYPKPNPGYPGYPKPNIGSKPGYGYPGYGIPAGGLKTGSNPFKKYPKIRGGYGSSSIGRMLGKGGTGKTLGAAMIGAGVGYLAGKAIYKLASLPFKLAMMNTYYPRHYMFDHHHDHYHDEHGHYLEADGVYYDHHRNGYVHDARINIPPQEQSQLPQDQKNITLLRYYPFNETHGLFEYSNQSTIYSYLQSQPINSGNHLSVILSFFLMTLISSMLLNT